MTIVILLGASLLFCASLAQGKKNCENQFQVKTVPKNLDYWLHPDMPMLAKDANWTPPIREANASARNLRNLLEEKLTESMAGLEVRGCWVILLEPSKDFSKITVRLLKRNNYKSKKAKKHKMESQLPISGAFLDSVGPLVEKILEITEN